MIFFFFMGLLNYEIYVSLLNKLDENTVNATLFQELNPLSSDKIKVLSHREQDFSSFLCIIGTSRWRREYESKKPNNLKILFYIFF